MQLSDRLLAIASYISPGEKVADIGTDHGLLPIFLYRNNIASNVILCDLKEGPLEKAKDNLDIFMPGYEADLRLGNGLETLEPKEVDTVIIAGMGGGMITSILSQDPSKTKSFRKYILQARSQQKELRIWLYKQGYSIVSEKLVREGKYICEIIVVNTSVPADMEERNKTFAQRLSDLEFEISPLLIQSNDPLLKELIEYRIKIGEAIIESIKKEGSYSSMVSLTQRTDRINRLRELYEEQSYRAHRR